MMAALGWAFSHRLYPIPFEWPRALAVAGTAGAVWWVSTLAPAGLWPAVAVKAALLAAFASILFASRLLRRPPGAIVEGTKDTLITGERS
jgi:hypothetical protein